MVVTVFPRGDDVDVQSVEVPYIPRCDREVVGFGCPSDQRITQMQHAPGQVSLRSKPGGPLRLFTLHRQDLVFVLLYEFQQGLPQAVSTTSLWESCKPNSSSCSTTGDSHRSSCFDRNAVTPGSGDSFVSSETTLVSSRNPVTRLARRRMESHVLSHDGSDFKLYPTRNVIN